MKKIIQVQNLRKSYGTEDALRGIDFHIKKGQIFALLGPNGAGKSTTVNILCTNTSADAGHILINGLCPGKQNKQIRSHIGVVFQNGVLDDLLTVEENLYLRGRFYGLKGSLLQARILHMCQITDILSLRHRQYGALSGGQRRRCDIARALLPLPQILFLDEPTTGLDPEIRNSLWKTIEKIKTETNMTILLTTHYMEEAVRANYISILNHGKIIAQGTPDILKETFSKHQLLLSPTQSTHLKSLLDQNHIAYHSDKNRFSIPLAKTLDALPLLNLCRGAYSGFEVLKGSMDDAYLSIIEGRTGHA